MAAQNPGQIITRRGSFDGTTTTANDLQGDNAVKPAIRAMLERTNKRYLFTLFTSGAVGPWGIKSTQSTKIPLVDSKKMIGDDAYRFDIIGRIEKEAVIVSQIGASGADGSFQLKMADSYLYPAQVVRFSSGKQARVMGYPTGSSASGWIYNFKTVTGTTFSYATDVAGNLSCFPMYTAYGEGSLRSDSRSKKPDQYVNHTTIQRKTVGITGSADSDVLWYEYADGQKIGWLYWKVDQMKAQVAAENERLTKFGISSMKNSDGSLRTESSLGNDPETGLPIVTGDGFEEQIAGINTSTGSGVNGEATSDDIVDMMKTIQQNSNYVNNLSLVCFTGLEGYHNAQVQAAALASSQNIQFFQNITGDSGHDFAYDCSSIMFAGKKIIFIVDPMLDDAKIFPARGNDGKLLSSGTYYFIGMNADAPTMEILAKGANGVNRSYVEATYGGLTGRSGNIVSEADQTRIACLKETVFCVYDPNCCGVIYKAS